MKIIHTADWHLGQTFFGYERGREHKVFLDWLCGVIKERKADLLLIAGDIFDTPNPSAEAQRMFYTFLTRLTSENSGLQVIITAGNHDSAARLEAPNTMFDVFNTTVSGVVHYKDGKIDYDRMIIPLNAGGCCLAVPYLRNNDLPDADSYSAGVAMLYDELYRRARERGYSPIIAMGHLQASGAEVSVGDVSEYAIIGGMEGIDTRFANEGIAYTALGHLHRAQRVARRENIRYSGAPLPMSFAERGNTQSVTEVVIDGTAVGIEKIIFDTPVKLLSLPSSPKPIDEVLKVLADLPDGYVNDNSPYLEVRVSITAPDTTLRQKIEDVLAGKSVRLARVEATGVSSDTDANQKPMTFDDFRRKNPLEIIQDMYERKCKEAMPGHLVEKLNNIIEEIRNEDIGNKRL